MLCAHCPNLFTHFLSEPSCPEMFTFVPARHGSMKGGNGAEEGGLSLYILEKAVHIVTKDV